MKIATLTFVQNNASNFLPLSNHYAKITKSSCKNPNIILLKSQNHIAWKVASAIISHEGKTLSKNFTWIHNFSTRILVSRTHMWPEFQLKWIWFPVKLSGDKNKHYKADAPLKKHTQITDTAAKYSLPSSTGTSLTIMGGFLLYFWSVCASSLLTLNRPHFPHTERTDNFSVFLRILPDLDLQKDHFLWKQ